MKTFEISSNRGPSSGNSYAIGDVHGCSKTLRKLVEDVLQLGQKDTLFLLGDYIDRGPNPTHFVWLVVHTNAGGHKRDTKSRLGQHDADGGSFALRASIAPQFFQLAAHKPFI